MDETTGQPLAVAGPITCLAIPGSTTDCSPSTQKRLPAQMVDCDGNTALHLASMAGQHQVVLALLDAGADVVAQNRYGDTPLHLAAATGHADVVDSLLSAGASPNAVNKSHSLPLECAAENNRFNIVNKLLGAGARPDACPVDNASPLSWAIHFRNKAMTKVLLEAGSTANGSHLLHNALVGCSWQTVQQLIAAGADVNIIGSSRRTPLHIAAMCAKADCVIGLLEAGADATAACQQGNNTLHYLASYSGSKPRAWLPEVVQKLVTAGCNVDLVNNNGETPLHIAVAKRLDSLVGALLAARAALDITNGLGQTFHTACSMDHAGLLNNSSKPEPQSAQWSLMVAHPYTWQ